MEDRQPTYVVAAAITRTTLAKRVEELVAKGYVPQGGVAALTDGHQEYFYQAMMQRPHICPDDGHDCAVLAALYDLRERETRELAEAIHDREEQADIARAVATDLHDRLVRVTEAGEDLIEQADIARATCTELHERIEELERRIRALLSQAVLGKCKSK